MVRTIAIVSLSSGILGEKFVKHEYELGIKRLHEYGISVKVMEHALKGIQYVKENPQKRAEDLLNALTDPSVDMILCAIGGDDTYRLLPYLFDDHELEKAVSHAKDKIFLGFSDTTWNHLMFHKVGMRTFYGQAFLPDLAELETEMLPYTKKYFEELITTGSISKIEPSDVWYDERTSFDVSEMGVPRTVHQNGGFELLQGNAVFSGEILGGCIDSLYDMFQNGRYEDTVLLSETYGIFPSKEEWRGKILLLETSEEKPSPEEYRNMLIALKKTGIFEVIHGILVGKPMDEYCDKEYKKALVEVVDDPKLPILYNVNIGHATPRCIIPFGVFAKADAEKQVILFET